MSSQSGTRFTTGIRTMRRWVAPAILLPALGLSLLPTTPAAQLVLAPGDRAPFLAGPNLDGTNVKVEWNRSKVTLVNFWAPWCEPCREEMPALQALYDRRAKDGLAIIGVHMLGPADQKTVDFLDELKIRYPIVLGSLQVSWKWDVGLLPTSYLIRPDGVIIRRYVGGKPGQIRQLVDDVEATLDGRPLGTMAPTEDDETPPTALGAGDKPSAP